MPAIRNSADLTNNGQGELAIMSIETYEELVGRIELYQSLQKGLDQINNGEVIEEKEMMRILNNYIGKSTQNGFAAI